MSRLFYFTTEKRSILEADAVPRKEWLFRPSQYKRLGVKNEAIRLDTVTFKKKNEQSSMYKVS